MSGAHEIRESRHAELSRRETMARWEPVLKILENQAVGFTNYAILDSKTGSIVAVRGTPFVLMAGTRGTMTWERDGADLHALTGGGWEYRTGVLPRGDNPYEELCTPVIYPGTSHAFRVLFRRFTVTGYTVVVKEPVETV